MVDSFGYGMLVYSKGIGFVLTESVSGRHEILRCAPIVQDDIPGLGRGDIFQRVDDRRFWAAVVAFTGRTTREDGKDRSSQVHLRMESSRQT